MAPEHPDLVTTILDELRKLREQVKHLGRLGIDSPISAPPISVIHDDVMAATAVATEIPFQYEGMQIGQRAIKTDTWRFWIGESYCDVALRNILTPGIEKRRDPRGQYSHADFQRVFAVSSFSLYLASSFFETLPKEVGMPTVLALREIRKQIGTDFTDRMVSYAVMSYDDSPRRVEGQALDLYFFERLRDGDSVIDNDGSNMKIITEI